MRIEEIMKNYKEIYTYNRSNIGCLIYDHNRKTYVSAHFDHIKEYITKKFYVVNFYNYNVKQPILVSIKDLKIPNSNRLFIHPNYKEMLNLR